MEKGPILLSSVRNTDFESDCACPISLPVFPTAKSVELHADHVYKMNPNLYTRLLEKDFSLFYDYVDPQGVVVLNNTAKQILEKFESPQILGDMVCFESIDKDVIQILSDLVKLNMIQTPSSFSSISHVQNHGDKKETPTLDVWLHITNQCNLSCDYCYIKKNTAKMMPEIALQSVEAIFRSATQSGFTSVKIKYAGGEPTLNFSVIKLVHAYAHEIAVKHGIHLQEVILTNATYLKPHIVDFLKKANISVMVSLDGLQDYNDEQRQFRNGKGAFRKIEDGLRLLRNNNVTPIISVTITNRNHKGLPALTEWLLNRKLPFTFNFYRENQFTASIDDLTYKNEDMITSLNEAFSIIEGNPPLYSLLGMLSDRARLDAFHDHACGAGSSYMVIDHEGKVSKCHMLMSTPVSSVLQDNPLQVIRNNPHFLQNPSVDEKEGCKQCEWRYVCAGGCPALTYRLTGRSDIKSPNCNIYKAIFPRILELEAVRLMKWSDC